MSRRIFTIAFAVSFPLFMLVLVMWIGSYLRPAGDITAAPRGFADTLRSSRGLVRFAFCSRPHAVQFELPASVAADDPRLEGELTLANPPRRWAGIQWQTGYTSAGPLDRQAVQMTMIPWRSVMVPHAYLATLTGAVPFWWGVRSLRRHLRSRLGDMRDAGL